MSEPGELEKKENHVEEALDWIVPQYEEDPVVVALVSALAGEAQLLEDAAWAVYQLSLDNAAGAQLDLFGRVLLEPLGNSIDDDEYRLRLKARGRILRSTGKRSDILQVFSLLMGGQGTREFRQHPPAKFELVLGDYALEARNINTFVRALRQARSLGVGAYLNFSLYPDEETFTLEHRPYTFLSSPSLVGATSLAVYDTSRFPPIGALWIAEGTTEEEAGYTYTVPDGTHFNVSLGLSLAHGAGTCVRLDDGGTYPSPRGLGLGHLRGIRLT